MAGDVSCGYYTGDNPKTTSLLRSRSKRCVTAQILTNTAKRKQGKRKTETRKLLCRQRSPFQFCCQIFDLIALKTRSDGSTAIRTANEGVGQMRKKKILPGFCRGNKIVHIETRQNIQSAFIIILLTGQWFPLPLAKYWCKQ